MLNEIKIRLTGTANLPTEPKLEKEYDITASNLEVTEVKEIPNGDGSVNRIFKLKITERSEVNLISENEVIKSKDKKSQSQKLRAVIFEKWNKGYTHIDREVYYQQKMQRIIDNEIDNL